MLPLTYRFLFLFFLIEFIGVTLLNKIIQVSDIQFYDLSSIHCIGCSPPHVKFPSVTVGHSFTLCSLHPPPLLLVITKLLSVCEDLLLLLFLTESLPPFHPALLSEYRGRGTYRFSVLTNSTLTGHRYGNFGKVHI